jgi:hypothetical protein
MIIKETTRQDGLLMIIKETIRQDGLLMIIKRDHLAGWPFNDNKKRPPGRMASNYKGKEFRLPTE